MSDKSDDGLRLGGPFQVHELHRDEEVVSVMVKEINRAEQLIKDLHSVASWTETVASAAFGVFVSAAFQVITNFLSSPPLWVVITAWVLAVAGLLVTILCVIFGFTVKDYAKKQKENICAEMESWKHGE